MLHEKYLYHKILSCLKIERETNSTRLSMQIIYEMFEQLHKLEEVQNRKHRGHTARALTQPADQTETAAGDGAAAPSGHGRAGLHWQQQHLWTRHAAFRTSATAASRNWRYHLSARPQRVCMEPFLVESALNTGVRHPTGGAWLSHLYKATVKLDNWVSGFHSERPTYLVTFSLNSKRI